MYIYIYYIYIYINICNVYTFNGCTFFTKTTNNGAVNMSEDGMNIVSIDTEGGTKTGTDS